MTPHRASTLPFAMALRPADAARFEDIAGVSDAAFCGCSSPDASFPCLRALETRR